MVYPIPSAPPAYLQPEIRAQAAQNYAQKHQKPDLNDDCVFCLDNLKTKPEGDINNGVVLAETECHHFFHEFCFSKFLENSLQTKAYKACPLCRYTIKKIDLVPVEDTATSSPARQSSTVTPGEPEGPSAVTRIVGGAVTGAFNVSKLVYNYITTESAQTTKDRLTKIEHCLAQLHIKWGSMPMMFQAEKRKMDVVISTMRSLIDNHSKRPIEAIISSKATEKQVQNLEKYTTAFEQSIKKAQLTLFADLEKLEVELAKIIK